MAKRRIKAVNGVRTLDWKYGYLTRDSVAWNPDTGTHCSYKHRPRYAEKKIPVLDWKAELFYTFTEPQTKLTYATYLTRLSSWDTFAAANGWTKVTLAAQSYQGRDIHYYLNPKTGTAIGDIQQTKIFVVTCMCHGDEPDGLNGAFKAMEVLSTNPRFQAFRDEWSMLFLPCMNPDGFNANQRGSMHANPADPTHYANLNRNFDFYWDEYLETGSEWKGSAPESEPEVSWICDYERACKLAGGKFGCVCDMHATEAFGSRYYTRMRLDNISITKGPTEEGDVPDAWVTQYLQEWIWRMDRGSQLKRYKETADGKPYHIKMLKGDTDPKMHSYFSSRGAYSTVYEEAKVDDVVAGSETVASASNCRLDHILNTAAAVTEAHWSYEDAILIEDETTNILDNTSFTDWNYEETRPTYWNNRRSSIIDATADENETFFDHASVVKMTSILNIELATASEYNSVCAALSDISSTNYWDNIAAVLSYGKFLLFLHKGKDKEEYNLSHATPVGACICSSDANFIHILGGGTAAETGAAATLTEVDFTLTLASPYPAPVITDITGTGTNIPAVIHAGYCDKSCNQYTTAANLRMYIVGGLNAAGNPTTTLGTYVPTTRTFTAAANPLPVALYGCACAYSPDNNCVYIFGGKIGVGMGDVATIYKWNLTGDTIAALVGVSLSHVTSFATAYYDTTSEKIYVMGGGSGGTPVTMTSVWYEFDPSDDTIIEIVPVWKSSDEYGSYIDVPWDTLMGRATSAFIQQNSSTEGKSIIVGGREDSGTGTLRADCITYNTNDESVNYYSAAEYAYLYNNSAVNLQFATQETDDFSGDLSKWSNPSSNWEIAAGAAQNDTSGNLILVEQPEYKNQQITLEARMSAGAAGGGTFSIFLRSAFSAGSITDGYEIRYNDTDSKWYIYRWVSSVSTLIHTYNAVAGTKLVSTGFRTVVVSVTNINPVILTASVEGTSIITDYDFETSRIMDSAYVGVGCSANGTYYWVVDDFDLDTGGFQEEIFSFGNYVRSANTTEHSIDRTAALPKSVTSNKSITRYCSTYFKTPPSTDYVFRKIRVSTNEGIRRYVEDGLYLYSRLYKDNVNIYITGPILQKGSMIPTSWMPSNITREAETYYWPEVLDLNNFVIKFKVVPTACFAEYTEDQEFIRIYYDAQNYIRLYYSYPTDFNEQNARSYYMGNDYSTTDGKFYDEVTTVHDPKFKMDKYVGNVLVSSVEIISYFGYSNLQEEACEFNVDLMEITISNVAGYGMELKLQRGGYEGRKFTAAGSTAFANSNGSVSLSGVGYWGKPELVEDLTTHTGRVVPASRAGLQSRLRQVQRHQLLAGDRDPSLGDDRGDYFYEIGGTTFGVLDDFNRSDNAELGGPWIETRNTGWIINSARARLSSVGVRGAAHTGANFPKNANYKVQANFALGAITSEFWLLGRWDWYDGGTTSTKDLTGYGVEVVAGAANTATVNLVRYYRWDFTGSGVDRTVLDSSIESYTLSATGTIWLSFNGSAITAQLGSGTILSAVDTCFPKSNHIGFYGYNNTGGTYNYVYNYYLYANFTNEYDD